MMKDDRTTEYLDSLKRVALRDEVRLTMREELEAYADMHAVRIADEERSIGVVQKYSVFALFTNLNTRNMKATLLIALMLTAGGTSFAAENAVPGELLYGVKLGVNENVKSAVTFGADAEATLQAQLLQERLEEAETLSKEGKLEGELAVRVRQNIQSQFERSYLASAEANAEVGADVRAQIAQSLSTFVSTMERGALAQTDGSVENNVEAGYAADAALNLQALDSSLAMESSSDMMGDDAGTSMMMTTKLAGEIDPATIVEGAEARLEALKKTISEAVGFSAEVKAEFEAQLEEAGEYMVTAQAELRADAEAEAEEAAQKANEILGEIESALSLMGQVEIDMNTGHIIGIDLSGDVNADATQNSDGIDANIDTMIDAAGEMNTDAVESRIESSLNGSGTLGL